MVDRSEYAWGRLATDLDLESFRSTEAMTCRYFPLDAQSETTGEIWRELEAASR